MWWYQNLWCIIKPAIASEIALHLSSTSRWIKSLHMVVVSEPLVCCKILGTSEKYSCFTSISLDQPFARSGISDFRRVVQGYESTGASEKHPLMDQAIACGSRHPRVRHITSPLVPVRWLDGGRPAIGYHDDLNGCICDHLKRVETNRCTNDGKDSSTKVEQRKATNKISSTRQPPDLTKQHPKKPNHINSLSSHV